MDIDIPKKKCPECHLDAVITIENRIARHRLPAPRRACTQCFGTGEYWTEWSDAAESDSELKNKVVFYPDPPDGTVVVKCGRCEGTGKGDYIVKGGRMVLGEWCIGSGMKA